MFQKTDSLSKKRKSISVSDFVKLVSDGKKKVLLIGVTDASREAYSRLAENGAEADITLWVDKKYNFFSLCGFPVEDCGKIPEKCFDTVIVSGNRNYAFYEKIAEKYGLISLDCYMLNVSQEESPAENRVPWKNLKYTDEALCDEELLLLDPRELLSESRLDIVIRYMAGIEILKGEHGEAVGMYAKLLQSMNDCQEFVRPYTTCAYFSAYEQKEGMEQFLSSFKELLWSMKEKGFDKRHFIPLSETMGVINGTHRIAAALIFGEKIHAKRYVGFGEPFLTFGFEDLKKRDYSETEIEKIKETFHNLKRGCLYENV